MDVQTTAREFAPMPAAIRLEPPGHAMAASTSATVRFIRRPFRRPTRPRVLRSPRNALLSLQNSLSEVTGPVFCAR